VAETVIGNDRRTNANADSDRYPYSDSHAYSDAHAYCHTNSDTYGNAECNSESHIDTDSDVDAYTDSNRHANFYPKAYPNPETSACTAPSPNTAALERKRSAIANK
jgi:hypothetical protein